MVRLLAIVWFVSLLLTLTVIDGLAQNVAQIDGTMGGQCSTNGVVSDIPGLSLHLATTGNPVLINYTVQFNASPTGQITIWPVIDGITQTSGQRDRAIGDFSGQTADVTFSRVYALGRGD